MRARPLVALPFSLRPLLPLLALPLLAASCSSSSTSGTPDPDAGATGDGGPVASNEAKQTGKVIGALDKLEIANATVTVAGKTAVTKADGTYEIVVPKNAPYSMSVTHDEHYKLNEQEWIVKTDTFVRGDTSLLSKDTANLLASFLPPRDPAKGLLVVRVQPIAPCDTEDGSTLAIEPKGTSKLTYFSGGRPNQSATAAKKGEAFAAAFSDVDTGVNVKVTVTSPLCEQLPYPVDFDGVTYTGNQKTEPGEVLSYVRVFIGPKK